MEVVARRKNSVVIGFSVGLGFLVVFFVGILIYMSKILGLSTFAENSMTFWVVFFMQCVLFLPIIGIFIWKIRKFQKTPRTPIVLENGKVCFANWFECQASEIENVTYQQARGGKYGWYAYQWGKLTVNVRGQKITYDFIDDVVAVHDRLLKLMLKDRENA